MLLSLILGSSPHLPVSVCGTGTIYNFYNLFSPVYFLIIRYFNFTISFDTSFSSSSLTFHSCVSYSFLIYRSAGISTCYPSDTLFGLSLGPDLPWADEPSPGNLRLSMAWILTMLSLLIPAFSLLFRPHILSIMLLPTIECSSTTHDYS